MIRKMAWVRTGLVFLIAAAVSLSVAAPASAAAYHTITIDGAVGDWVGDESMLASGTYENWYFTWDATNLYVAADMSRAHEGAGAGADVYHVYIDTNPAAVSGAPTSVSWGSGSQNFTSPFRPDYYFYTEPNAAPNEGANVYAGGWGAGPTNYTYGENNVNGIFEVKIPFSDLGVSVGDTIRVFAFHFDNDDDWNWSKFPATARNEDGTPIPAKDFDDYWEVVLRAGAAPAGADTDVVLTEVMYDARATEANKEYVELWNRGRASVYLDGWAVNEGAEGGVPFAHDRGVQCRILHPNAYGLVVGTDWDTDGTYNVTEGAYVTLIGAGQTFSFDNTAETVILLSDLALQMDSYGWTAANPGDGRSYEKIVAVPWYDTQNASGNWSINSTGDTSPARPNSNRLSAFLVRSDSPASSGTAFACTVTALNCTGGTIPGYNIPCTVSVSAGYAVAPSTVPATFTGGTASVNLTITGSSGYCTITVRNLLDSTCLGETSVRITAPPSINGFHVPQSNLPDTAPDADSYMRTAASAAGDTMWPRRRTRDNPVVFWVAKTGNAETPTVRIFLDTGMSYWDSMAAADTVVQSDSLYFRFSLDQQNNASYDWHDTVGYYFRFVRTGYDTTYVYGSGAVDNVTTSNTTVVLVTAQGSPFIYRIRSTTPGKVDTAASPVDGDLNVNDLTPTLQWTPGADSDLADGDTFIRYDLQISTSPTMSPLTSDSGFVGWGGNTYTVQTPLVGGKWYYWRVRAMDVDSGVGAWMDTARFYVDQAISVDGNLSDWQTGERFAAHNSDGVYFTWDSANIYLGWDRSTTFDTEDVFYCYVDTKPGGISVTPDWNGAGTHTLPFAADALLWCRIYESNNPANNPQWDYHLDTDNNGTWDYKGAVPGSNFRNGTIDFVELSAPWSMLGNVTQCTFVFFVTNEWGTNYIFVNVPPANRHGASSVGGGQQLTCWLGPYTKATTPRANGIQVNHPMWFKTSRTLPAPPASYPIAFTPIIDGVKDPQWGTVPSGTSSPCSEPVAGRGDTNAVVPSGGLARDVYVTNDAEWLYIGWQASGDPYELEADAGKTVQAAHYAFAVGDTSSWGSPYDPFKTTGTTRLASYGAEAWLNGWIGYLQDWTQFDLRTSNGAEWDPVTVLTEGADWKVEFDTIMDGWGEVRVPLSEIGPYGTNVGDTLVIVHTSRYSALSTKGGLNDMTPHDANALSNWADGGAVIDVGRPGATNAIVYRVRPAGVDAYHVPDSEPISGRGKMHQPDTTTSSDRLFLRVRAYPNGVLTSGQIKYSTDDWAETRTEDLSYEFASGGADFYYAYLPTLSRGVRLEYYASLLTSLGRTYVYGNRQNSYTTTTEATAQAGAFAETVTNSAPTGPNRIEVSPLVAGDADDLVATASGATDADTTDAVAYKFEWRNKNGALIFTQVDGAAPYTSTLSNAATTVGDTYRVYVSAGDGVDTSAAVAGPTAILPSLVAWNGDLPVEVNAAALSDSEWIWRDKAGDERYAYGEVDIQEARIQVDATDLYLLLRFRSLSDLTRFHAAVTIDTDLAAASGGAEIGDQSSTSLDSELSAPPARWEARFALRAETAGAYVVDLDTGGGWRKAPSCTLLVQPGAATLEARIRRTDLLLDGPCTPRIALAFFENVLGAASATNTTRDWASPCDALDAASLPTDEQNDASHTLGSGSEDLSDGDLDLWFEVRLAAADLAAETYPAAPGGCTPSAVAVDTTGPTLRWTIPADPDSGDTVLSYLVEVAAVGDDLDETILYRVVVADTDFRLATVLSDGETYVWRIRARDRSGLLGPASEQTFTVRLQNQIEIAAPRDDQNPNNYGVLNGLEVAPTAALWRWAPGHHTLGYDIDSYVLQVSSDPGFAAFDVERTVDSSVRICTAGGLVRGRVYYARVRGVDTGGNQGDWSATSDGILVCRRQVNSDSSDWAPDGAGYANDSAYYVGGAWGEGLWADTYADQRGDSGSPADEVDLTEVHVTADSYNLYFLVATKSWSDGALFLQTTVSYDGSSDQRVLIGRDVVAEDAWTSAEASWEWLLRLRTGNDDLYAVNPYFQYFNVLGGYSENAGQKFVEFAVPLDKVGGAERFLGETVDFTVTAFWKTSAGGIGDINGAASVANVADVVSTSAGTWAEVSDRTVEYRLRATFSDTGEVRAFSGALDASPVPPEEARNSDGAPVSSNLHWIMYNMFVDRFFSGDNDNQPGDLNMVGGDFEGIIEKIEYLQGFGVNVIYLGPSLDFGGGAWGYNQSDLYRIQWSFADQALGGNNGDYNARYGFRSLAELVRQAHRRNMEVFIDWIPGQIYNGRTVQNHPTMFSGSRFGGERVQQDMVEARQFFSDHARFLWSQGLRGFRVDNPKFYPDDYTTGHPFFRYVRDVTDEFAPELYTFGEVPDNAYVTGSFCYSGDMINGMLMFPDLYVVQQYVQDGGGASFQSTLEGNEGSYGANSLMSWFFENHDHSRTYHQVGGGGDDDGSKNSAIADRMRTGYTFGATHTNNPVIFYGDEFPINGWHSMTYPLSSSVYTQETGKFGNTRAINWNDNQFTWYQNDLRDAFSARAVFPALRGGRSGRFFIGGGGANGGLIAYRRQWGGGGNQEKVVASVNADDDAAWDDQDLDAGDGGPYEDWLTGNWATMAGNWITDGNPRQDGRIWVKGGFGKSTVFVNAGFSDVICTLDHDTLTELTAYYTRKSGTNGWAQISNVVTDNATTTPYTLRVWRQGYQIFDSAVSIAVDSSSCNVAVDVGRYVVDLVAPPMPTGLSAVARAEAAVLTWDENQGDSDFESFYVYRAQNPGGPWTMVAECFQPTLYECDYDEGLTNDDTYYYCVRARDRNDNLSAYSSVVSVVPRTYTAKFYLYTPGAPSYRDFYICGNHEDLNQWTPKAMTQLDDDMWYFEVELDPTSRPEYKYQYNDGGGYTWEASTFSNELGTGNRIVRIVDHSGNGEAIFTNAWQTDGDIAPRPPQAISADGTDTGIYVGWEAALEPDVERYRLYRSLDGSSYSALSYIDAAQNQFLDTTVAWGQVYYYKVSAVDWWGSEGSQSTASSAMLALADTRAPDTPAGLALAPAGATAVLFTWNASSAGDLAGYDLYRSTDPICPTVAANRVNASRILPSFTPQYLDTGVTTGVRFYYRVTAADDSGNVSPGSDTQAAMLVGVYLKVDMGTINPSAVVAYGDAPTMTTSGHALTQISSYYWADTVGLFAGTTYRYRYRFNAVTNEGAFATASGDREYAPPEAPTATLLQDWEEDPTGPIDPQGFSGNRAAYLSWTADSSADVVGYYVDRADTDDSTYTRITPTLVTATAYSDAGLANGETYSYIIRSVDGGGLVLESRPVRVVVVTPREPVWIRFRVEAPRREARTAVPG